MYTQQDLDQINAQEQKRWRLLVIPEVLLLAALVYSLVIRVEWLTTVLTCVMAFLFIFCYGIAIKPLRCYAKHLQNALHGRTRVTEGTFKRLDTEESMVDGVTYRAMIVSVGNPKDEEDDRLYYYDVEKPLPDFAEGTKLRVTYHDREVADLGVL